MNTFRVYKHPAQGFEAVKEGFSWPALFFGPLWLLFKQLWLFAVAWITASVILSSIEGISDEVGMASGPMTMVYLLVAGGYLALWLIPAFKGNSWRAKNLLKRGYTLVRTVQAKTPDSAVTQLLQSLSSTSPQQAGHSIPSPAKGPHFL
jgi:uncharacterized membrane protein required for colicin V production